MSDVVGRTLTRSVGQAQKISSFTFRVSVVLAPGQALARLLGIQLREFLY